MRIARKRTWGDLRGPMASDLGRAFPVVEFALSGPDEDAVVAWHEGPSESAVAAVIGDLPAWDLTAVPAFLAVPEVREATGRPLLVLRRSYSEAALAVAVVRFQASNVRPYSSANPAHRLPMGAILDTDDPARCDYPIVERMAALLLDAGPAGDPPDAPPGSNPADRLSSRLGAIGYENLWNRAWLEVDL